MVEFIEWADGKLSIPLHGIFAAIWVRCLIWPVIKAAYDGTLPDLIREARDSRPSGDW